MVLCHALYLLPRSYSTLIQDSMLWLEVILGATEGHQLADRSLLEDPLDILADSLSSLLS